MNAKRVISRVGPAIQLTAISQFIARFSPGVREAYLSRGGHATNILAVLNQPIVFSLYLLGPHPFARHSGMGSLPSATITASWVFTAVWSDVVVFGTAE